MARWLVAFVAVAALIGAGCGDDDSDSTGTSASTTVADVTTTVADDGGGGDYPGGDDGTDDTADTTDDSAAGDGTVVTAELSGANEVPPGAEGATGEATVTITDEEICWVVSVDGLGEQPTAAHIHAGAVGVPGDVVHSLGDATVAGTDSATYEGCSAADPSLTNALRADPAGYYVNVHTATFPAGAVRGNLVLN